MQVTIFTPTYNRAYYLPRLYESLKRQTSNDFEWIVVDDGSTDDTEELISHYIKESIITIKYLKQANGGKHRAINKGVSIATGYWFYIVDSDDYLTDDAIEWIIKEGRSIESNCSFAGIAGIKIDKTGKKVGGGCDFGTIDSNAIDIRIKDRISGDLSEVVKTQIFREIPFPEYEGEKFCPEAIVWFRIARKYKMRYIYKGIYVCEYLPDGLTAKIVRIRRESANASMTYYSEHFHDNIPLGYKLKAAVNFWRFSLKPYKKRYRMHNLISILCYIPGKIMMLRDLKCISD